MTIAGIVLAAGLSSRAGEKNKLLARYHGKPMLESVVAELLRSRLDSVIVVTGHDSDDVRAALDQYDVRFVHNDAFAEGMSTSIAAGIKAVDDSASAAVVCLGDMPRVNHRHVNALIEAFARDDGREICVLTHDGRRGNPVLWSRRFFPELQSLTGDVGAKHLIEKYADRVVTIPVDDDAILFDVDTPSDFNRQ